MIDNAIFGAGAGVARALLGFFGRENQKNDFEWKKAGKTIFVSCVAGLVLGFMGIEDPALIASGSYATDSAIGKVLNLFK